MMYLRFSLTISVLILGMASASGEVVVVVNAHSGLVGAKGTDILKIFTGRATQLNDIPIKPVLQKKDRSHAEFLEKYISRTNIQFSNAWKKLVFTGKASMPMVLEDDMEVIREILDDPKLIGYVDRANVGEGLTILDMSGNCENF
jgi:ABC-type phosphate transport system substrate-binding protein